MSMLGDLIGLFFGGGDDPQPSFQSGRTGSSVDAARSGRVVDSARTNRYAAPSTGQNVQSYNTGMGGKNLLAYGARPGATPMVRTNTTLGVPEYSPLASLKNKERDVWNTYLQEQVPGFGDVGRELGALHSVRSPLAGILPMLR